MTKNEDNRATVKAARINFKGRIIAAIIGGSVLLIIALFQCQKNPETNTIQIDKNENSPVANNVENQTINYNFNKDPVSIPEKNVEPPKNKKEVNTINIRGSVLDQKNNVIPNAKLLLEDGQEIYTDQNGFFSFHLTKRKNQIKTIIHYSKKGYKPLRKSININIGQTTLRFKE